MNKTTNKDLHPPIPDYGDHWERGTSPWHKDAFPEEFKSSAPEQGARKEGWYLIDWCGNEIGFVPDGTPFLSDEQKEPVTE